MLMMREDIIPDNESTFKNTVIIGIITTFLLFAVIVVTSLALNHLNYPNVVRDRLLVVQIFVSAATSALLVTVYVALVLSNRDQLKVVSEQANEAKRLANIQEDQINIQETQLSLQQELSELQKSQNTTIEGNHIPVLQISVNKLYKNEDGEHVLVFSLENKGNGLAQNITTSMDLEMAVEISGHTRYLPTSEIKNPSSPDGIFPSKNHVSPINSATNNERGLVLQAGEKEDCRAVISFEDTRFDRNIGDLITEEVLTLSEALKFLDSNKPIKVSFNLRYEDIFGDPKGETFFKYHFESDDPLNFTDLF